MEQRWPLFPKFVAFLESRQTPPSRLHTPARSAFRVAHAGSRSGRVALSRDVWRQMLQFAAKVPSSVDQADDDSAWPLLYDEFVDFLKKDQKKK